MSKSTSPWDHPYLNRQLIAYIGNKRSLLPFLGELFSERSPPSGPRGTRPLFLDPFAGSGAVARLAKFLGYAVTAGDWEHYSFILNRAHVGIDATEANQLFRDRGGLNGVIARLNALDDSAEPYIARHFAPAATETADYRTERLFYTRENALFIDAVRHEIERMYPEPVVGAESSANLPAAREKALLIAALLYQAATHANTSGVFKAYHKGFGGHGKDALTRIMRPMALQVPLLFDGAVSATIYQAEAAAGAATGSYDVAYLDPPYTGHQYGSNYFLLNSIALWDRPDVPAERRPDGRLMHKAGIRPDWRSTRSDYCYRESAPRALAELLKAIDAGRIYLSYNTEGIIPFDHLLDLLEKRGRVELFLKDYTVYRGGKQSIRRSVQNAELVLLVSTNERPRPRDRARIEDNRRRQAVARLLRGRFVPRRLRAAMPIDGVTLQTEDGYRIASIAPALEELSADSLLRLQKALVDAQCQDHFEEISVLAELLRWPDLDPKRQRDYQRRALWCLRKFSFRRYEERFLEAVELLKGIANGLGGGHAAKPEAGTPRLQILREGLSREVKRGMQRIVG